MKKKILNKLLFLKKLIEKYNFEYYILSYPSITDEIYDNIIIEYNKLKKKYFLYFNKNIKYKRFFDINILNLNTPTFNSTFTIKHYEPMLSLNNVYCDKQFNKFILNLVKKHKFYINKLNMYCDLKIDGIAINLLYYKGNLIKASTRGNGLFGEDITTNIKLVNDIPKKINLSILNNIPNFIEIRGEIYINKYNFNKLNKSIIYKKFSNSRNLASGSIRNTNKNIKKKLNFFAYNLYLIDKNYQYNNYFLLTQVDKIDLLKKLNFPVSKFNRLCTSINEVIKYYKIINKLREELKFDIDGIVIKINSLSKQKIIGNNKKHPKWAIAYKFNSFIKISYIIKIIYKISRIGELVPIAIIKPININGVIIKKVYLYNFNQIKKLNLHIKDTVLIKRAGDVIPKIIKVITFSNKNKDIIIPKYCPFCNNKLLINNNNYRCIKGIKCKGQLIKLIIHFISKNGFNIKFIGKKTIIKLLNKKIIFLPYQIFNINIIKLRKLGIISINKINNILNSINLAKKIKLENFIYSLSIPKIGLETTKKLSNNINDINKIIKIDLNTLKKIKIKNVENIYNYFNNTYNIKNILLLLNKVTII